MEREEERPNEGRPARRLLGQLREKAQRQHVDQNGGSDVKQDIGEVIAGGIEAKPEVVPGKSRHGNWAVVIETRDRPAFSCLVPNPGAVEGAEEVLLHHVLPGADKREVVGHEGGAYGDNTGGCSGEHQHPQQEDVAQRQPD